MSKLPYEIRQQIIQCIGTCFYFKDNVETFLLTCGVERELARKHRPLPKFVWARNLLADLDEHSNGYEIQRRILTEFCNLRGLPDKDAQNPDVGLEALRKLKRLSVEHDLFVEDEHTRSSQRKALAAKKAEIIKERKNLLIALREKFIKGISSPDRQAVGYSLEDILEQLFPIFEIEYRKSYKTGTQQIDGHFRFEGFDYLVEARWRVDQPNEQEIGGFKRKVDTKLESTRGVFISINGFREEVIQQFSGQHSNILFIIGEDMMHILEGRIDLREALHTKIQKAAQEGCVFIPISLILSKRSN